MASTTFGAFLDIESGPSNSDAFFAKPRSMTTRSRPSASLELTDLRPRRSSSIAHEFKTPDVDITERATVELSQHDTSPEPQRHIAVEALQNWTHGVNRWRVVSCCVCYLANGLSDSAAGALLPYMQTHYNIGYAIVSLIFVAQALGFLTVAFFNEAIKSRLGYAKSYILAELILVAAYAIIVATPPYPAVVVAYYLIGCAMSTNLALGNVFCANLANSTVVLGIAHGLYGVGGTIGPIIATLIVSRGGLWSRYFFITLGMCIVGGLSSGWTFKSYEKENHAITEIDSQLQARQRRLSQVAATNKRALLVQALKFGVTITGALFTFAYQGAEVSISGWVISFLITERQGDPGKVGYVTAGFWGGITLGRFTLAHLAQHLGERRFVFALAVLAGIFELVVWLVPNVIGDSIAVALVGYVLGPIAPCSVVVFVRHLPRSLQTISLGFISSAGASGGAVWPFLTGLIAQSKGTFVLHPICIGLFAFMLACWWMLPSVEKREE